MIRSLGNLLQQKRQLEAPSPPAVAGGWQLCEVACTLQMVGLFDESTTLSCSVLCTRNAQVPRRPLAHNLGLPPTRMTSRWRRHPVSTTPRFNEGARQLENSQSRPDPDWLVARTDASWPSRIRVTKQHGGEGFMPHASWPPLACFNDKGRLVVVLSASSRK